LRFVVIARDGSDVGAPQRRAAIRPNHLAYNAAFEERGNVLVGGALIEDGVMVGTVMVVDFPARSELDAWIHEDPYRSGGVWHEVEVHAFGVAAGSWVPTD
jgi:uncharacterized protein